MSGPNCSLCGSSETVVSYQIPDFWLDRMTEISVFLKCNNCGLIFQFPQPLPEEWPNLYPDNYSVYLPSRSSFIHNLGYKKRSRVVLEHKAKGKLLDVGCGNGGFMIYMLRYGWETIGIERNRKIAEKLTAEQGLKIYSDTLEEISFPSALFDVITMWDVLEHLPEPLLSLKECQRILQPEGILVLRLPNYESRDAHWFGKYWAGLDAPRHFYVFGKRNIVFMLEKAGFAVQKIQTDVGEYLNFVKSIQFWMTGKGIAPRTRKIILTILRSLPFRVVGVPLMMVKDIGARGSEMVIVAKKIS